MLVHKHTSAAVLRSCQDRLGRPGGLDPKAEVCLCVAAAPVSVQLESGTVDDELAMLKKGMLGAGSKKEPVAALPEGRPVKDAIDMELEELRKKARE